LVGVQVSFVSILAGARPIHELKERMRAKRVEGAETSIGTQGNRYISRVSSDNHHQCFLKSAFLLFKKDMGDKGGYQRNLGK
jgi:hypothetical protein